MKTKSVIAIFILLILILTGGLYYYERDTYAGKFLGQDYMHIFDKNSKEAENGFKINAISCEQNLIRIAEVRNREPRNINSKDYLPTYYMEIFEFPNPVYDREKKIITADNDENTKEKMEVIYVLENGDLKYKGLIYKNGQEISSKDLK